MSMGELLRNAVARTPLDREHVQAMYAWEYNFSPIMEVRRLCESHERLRMELESATKAANEINELLRSKLEGDELAASGIVSVGGMQYRVVTNANSMPDISLPWKGQWLPIETAPKDGTEFLAYFGKFPAVTSYCDEQFHKKPQPHFASENVEHMGVKWMRQNQPTHWMPIPEPPEAK